MRIPILLLASLSCLALSGAVVAKEKADEIIVATGTRIPLYNPNPGIQPLTSQPTSAERIKVMEDEAVAFHLKSLFAASDEASLKRQPLNALYRGDLRYADQLGDLFSDAATEANYRAALSDMAALNRIPRTALSATDQLAFDVFKWQTDIEIRGTSPEMRALTDVRPIDHFNGIQTQYPDIASGQGAAPFLTLTDYENNIKRNQQYAAQLDSAIARFKEGEATCIVQPKLIVQRVIEQLDAQIKEGGAPFLMPLKKFPDSISATDRARLTADTKASVTDSILPAYKRLRDFLKNDYLAKARAGVGLHYMKGGDTLYRYLVELNTTLPLDPAVVHATGLREVIRIKAEMEKIKHQLGFKGTLAAFFVHIRDDPQFQPKSAQWLHDQYLRIGQRINQHIPEQFSTIPKSPLEIRAEPSYREKTAAAGEYMQGTPDGARPGVFYYNSYDLPSRNTIEMETLYLHEAIPGHHFQISIAQEDARLPNFMRFGGNTAYVEGWALYSESLWHDMGMETDPYQRFGGLNDEMLRAMRLVVDTGIHANGWSREKAIKYMIDNSAMSVTDVTAEVERYIAYPAQALAYKTGQMTIQRLKAKAKAALGAGFDPRKFHAQVLNTGALPLGVLEIKINAWIVAGGIAAGGK